MRAAGPASVIASLYGSPSPSMISRDPDGIHQLDSYTSSVDPPEDRTAIGGRGRGGSGGSASVGTTGIDPDDDDVTDRQQQERNAFSPGSSPSADNSIGRGGLPKSMDIARLVGVPPPPPPMMPPPRKTTNASKRTVVKTPRTTNGKKEGQDNVESVDTLRHNPYTTNGEDQATTPTAAAVATLVVQSTKSIDDGVSIDEIERTRSDVNYIGGELSGQTEGQQGGAPTSMPTPPDKLTASSSSPAKSIVEERLQKALSIYKSDELVLDADEANNDDFELLSTEKVPTPTPVNVEDVHLLPSDNRLLSPTPRARGLDTRSNDLASPSPKKSVCPSPTNSEDTRPHSNQTMEEGQTGGESEGPFSNSSRGGTSSKQRMMIGDDGGSRSRRRAFSLERKQRRGASPKNAGQKKTNRRGFFKKLFRSGGSTTAGGRNDNGRDIDDKSLESEEQREQQQQASSDVAAVATGEVPAVGTDDDDRQPPSPKMNHLSQTFQPLQDESRAGDSNEVVPLDAFPKNAFPDILVQPHMSHDHGKVNIASVPHVMALSQGDDPNVDPESGLQEQFDVEVSVTPSSVKSKFGRKARKSFSQDPPDDEHGDPPMHSGRPLISPSALQRNDSAEDESSSPMNQSEAYSFDGFQRKTGADPSPKHEHIGLEDPPLEAKTGPLPTPSHLVRHLHVDIHGPSIDPVGATPIIQGRNAMNRTSTLADPLGNSPMAWRVSNALEVQASAVPPDDHALVDAHDASKSPSEQAMSLLDDQDKMEVKNINMDIPDPTLEQGYQSEESEKGDEQNAPLPSTAEKQTKLTIDSTCLTKPMMSKSSVPKDLNREGAAALSWSSRQVTTEAEKKGFKLSSSPANRGKHLTVSAAAFTNAQAVAFFHKLDGEPSPRHSWHVSKSKKNARTYKESDKQLDQPKASRKTKNKKKTPSAMKKMTSPSPDEYSATNFVLDDVATHLDFKKSQPSRPLQHVPNDPNKMFTAYSRFKGRVPSRRVSEKPKSPVNASPALEAVQNPVKEAENFKKSLALVVPLGKITGHAVSRGIKLRRQKREDDIAKGRSDRVIITPRSKPLGANRFKMIRADESDIKDPIQRAGRRLLSKAAVPIQCAARRYLAQQAALDRMWAIIQIQSVIRRWRCEVNLQAHIHSATVIQSACRGWLGRQQLKREHSSAVTIQKMVRGYITAIRTYDMIYFICQAQAMCRGALVRIKQKAQTKAAIDIQRAYRTHHTIRSSVIKIQAQWRSHHARVDFQMTIVDVIMMQSIVRRWSAKRVAILKRNAIHSGPVTMIQTLWRRHHAMCMYKKHVAARKIQAQWRGFQCYSDYIFTIVDVLVVQRFARQWLAVRKVQALRKDLAATSIQKTWRRHKVQKEFLISLAKIMIVQSVARRYISKFRVAEQKMNEARYVVQKQQRKAAAIAIQKAWRGFWAYSHFIIVQYECTRIQALTRGVIARKNYNLHLGCAILIQATMRRRLATKAVARMCLQETIQLAQVQELRERNAARRIQFWWRIVMDWMKEKKAALVIERFFIAVKAEVDSEVVKRQLKKVASKERKESKAMRGEDHLLERAWLKTVDENNSAHSSCKSKSNSPSHNHGLPPAYGLHRVPNMKVNPRLALSQPCEHGGVIAVASSSSFAAPPTHSVRLNVSEDFSELTTPSVLHHIPTHNLKQSKNNQLDDMFLEETFEKTFEEAFEKTFEESKPVRPKSTKNRLTTEDYIRKYGGGGMKTAPNRLSKSGSGGAFFSDGTHTTHVSTPTSSSSSTAQSAQSAQSFTKRRHSAGMSISIGPEASQNSVQESPRVPSTPRSNASPRKSRRSQSSPKTIPMSRRDSSSHFPPMTPTRHHQQKPPIISRGTIDTEIQSSMSGATSYSRSSPRTHGQYKGKNPIMVMNTYLEPNDGQSVLEEAHEMLLLGEEYGEV